jgi:hypothetical protein
MTPNEWAGFTAGICAVVTSLLLGLRFLIKGWLNELRPNGVNSMKDKLNRLEARVDELFTIISKS